MTGNNPNLDLVNINAHTKFGQIRSILKILSGNEILKSGHNSVTIVRKIIHNNPNLDHVKISVYTKFGKILLNWSQYIERKGTYHGRNDRLIL